MMFQIIELLRENPANGCRAHLYNICYYQMLVIWVTSGLEKSVVQLSGTNRFYCLASNHSFSPSWWVSAQARYQLNRTKVSLELPMASKIWVWAACPKCKLEFKFFFALYLHQCASFIIGQHPNRSSGWLNVVHMFTCHRWCI